MNAWIDSLWCDLEDGKWGTETTIGATWDLCGLVDCGLVDGAELDKRLEARVNRELLRVRKAKRYCRQRDWLFVQPPRTDGEWEAA